MKTNREHFAGKRQAGNALIYVLIAIALFAALSMTLGRQTDTSESSSLSDDKAALYATQLISYAAQAKSAVDQMLFSGASIDQLDFARPGSATYDAGATTDKIKRVYHPDGGGLSAGTLSEEVLAYTGTDPEAGWYMGRFNNIEWTKTTATDVVLVAYGINKKVCQSINIKANGSPNIPQLTDSIKEILIDDVYHTGVNTDFTTDSGGTPICAACDKVSSLCVEDAAAGLYGFYAVIENR